MSFKHMITNDQVTRIRIVYLALNIQKEVQLSSYTCLTLHWKISFQPTLNPSRTHRDSSYVSYSFHFNFINKSLNSYLLRRLQARLKRYQNKDNFKPEDVANVQI